MEVRAGASAVTRVGEGMKRSRDKQKHLAQSRKDAEAEKKAKELVVVSLCVSASLREFVDFFTPSDVYKR